MTVLTGCQNAKMPDAKTHTKRATVASHFLFTFTFKPRISPPKRKKGGRVEEEVRR